MCTAKPYRGVDKITGSDVGRRAAAAPKGRGAGMRRAIPPSTPLRLNCTVRARGLTFRRFPERCPSGLRSTPGKCVYGKTVPRVRIPPSPPYKSERGHSAPFTFVRRGRPDENPRFDNIAGSDFGRRVAAAPKGRGAGKRRAIPPSPPLQYSPVMSPMLRPHRRHVKLPLLMAARAGPPGDGEL